MPNTLSTLTRQAATQYSKATRLSRHYSRLAGEIIPDSEEERRKASVSSVDVIEISSDEDETLAEDASIEEPLSIPGSWPTKHGVSKTGPRLNHEVANFGQSPSANTVKATPRKTYRARRIIFSSSSDDSDSETKVQGAREIIELSDSSPERHTPRNATGRRSRGSERVTSPQVERPLDADEQGTSDEDGAILILDEPRSARRPLRQPSLFQGPDKITEAAAPESKRLVDLFDSSQESDDNLGGTQSTPLGTPTRRKLPVAPSTPVSITKAGTKPKPAPRTGKKAQAAADLLRRQRYAQEFFEELNRTVFKGGLPKDTKLNWSKRLLTTAGKARWHRSREGVQTTEIELAEKILDCDERIRNTLSHEMCHLASWIIDGDPKEGHGRLWKAWTAKVMRKHPEIAITTRHDYEISYTYQWKCQKCGKIYGRFSNSIRVDECVCGACREGKLVPLFNTRTSKTPKTSRMAPTRPRDSPCSILSGTSRTDPGANTLEALVHMIPDSHSDTDAGIAGLTTAMASVTFMV
ncbi:putative sprT homologue [Lyophyllum shimeji]|uniref:SprT homologue n=1 Tax=Lyophyllum shimeji TaxID=47721 RepID=A0A9P3PJF4_LYOSH|nr:putative sprT homologue [Lyophyllum shimeji]